MIEFRHDINGLRALAVLSVVLFHAKLPLLAGGYVGVDVFFVISGFLMTQIICGKLDGQSFSLLRFWAARARRILPALVFLCLVILVFGWLFLDPITYEDVGRHAAGSLTFLANVQLWREAGYFDDASETKWLLHTWSLALEWQFYVAYPIALSIAYRVRGRRAVLGLLWIGLVGSLALSVVATALRPTMAFYLLPTRAWEFIAGGLVFLHADRLAALTDRSRRAVEIAGLAFIVVSAVAFRPSMPWPSYLALLPVFGSAAVISSNLGGRSSLNFAGAQAVGTWSYSIYLWHWPAIVAFRYFDVDAGRWAAAVPMALALVLGAASYRLVERAWQRSFAAAPRAAASILALSVAGGLVWSGADVMMRGFVARAPRPATIAAYQAARLDWSYPPTGCSRLGRDRSIVLCRVGAGGDGGTLVVGDSHADQWYPRAAALPGADVAFLTRDGCPSLPDVVVPGADCRDFYRVAMDAAESGGYRRVILSSFWTSCLSEEAVRQGVCIGEAGRPCASAQNAQAAIRSVFARFASDLAPIARAGQVVIVLPDLVPTGDLPVQLAKRAFFGRPATDVEAIDRADAISRTESVRSALKSVAEKVGAAVVDPLDAQCGPASCPLVDERGAPLFKDSNHLRSTVVRERYGFLDPYLVNAPGDPQQRAVPEEASASTEPR